jgi:signal transduction histidine kinase
LSHELSTGTRSGLWLPALLALAFVLLNLSGWRYYQNLNAALSDTFSTRLLESTKLVASNLDGQSMKESSVLSDPEIDSVLFGQINAAKDAGPFEDIHLFRQDKSSWFDDAPKDVKDQAALLAGAAGPAFDSALHQCPCTGELYPTLDQYYLAACVPVVFADEVIGVVVAEADADYFSSLHSLRQGLLLLDGFAALLFLSIGLIWTGVQRRLARAETAALRSAQLAAMGQMVATVAHELKNPLGIIKNSAERIRTKYGTPDEPLFDFIPEEVDRLDGLLRRYLQFARLEIATTEVVDLSPFVEKLATQINPETPTGVALTVRVPEGLTVHADPAALRQVLLNLVLNALEACRQDEGGEVSLFANSKGRTVEIVVSDTGVGMTPETLRRASEPFFTTRPDGSGLGIYLAQTLTEKMNGTMTIRSRTGEGTSVSLVLPMDSAT